jgi:general secretion pathway protein D
MSKAINFIACYACLAGVSAIFGTYSALAQAQVQIVPPMPSQSQLNQMVQSVQGAPGVATPVPVMPQSGLQAQGLSQMQTQVQTQLPVPPSVPVAPAAPITARRGEPITLNFVNAEIEAVARTIAVITGRNVVVDPRVKGVMTLTTERPVSPAVAYNQFLATLRLQGFTVVDASGLDKVVPEADAKLQGGAVTVGEVPAGAVGNQIVTQIFKLNYEAANNLVAILRPLISPNNTINVNPGNNSLVITDYADNLRRLAKIIAAMDVANATDVEIIALKHAIASDLAPLVLRLLEPPAGAAGGVAGQAADSSFRTTLVAEPRSNTLILRAANPARVALVKALIDKLDQPNNLGPNGALGNIYVVYLKNAEAVKLAVTLRAALSGEARAPTPAPAATPAGVPGGAANQAFGQSAQPSTGGQIQADPATNSLIITASEPQFRQLRAVIDQLDVRRAQVFVESLIAEVNADKAAEFGIQWQGVLGQNGDSMLGLLGTNFSIGGANLLSLASGGGQVLPSTGANFGIANKTNGIYVLGFLARYLQSNGDGNILSTPNLLTLDNEEAKIVIGQNVPFVTGQFTNAGGNANTVNPFQTIERKDVGLTLKVKPQISENGTVRLSISQEVSTVQASTINSPNGPTTNKRSIDTNVLVADGSIVVLGGLLQDEFAGNQEKVPGLGDIPFFGNLFKSETRSRKKTNLMVFLRPVVVRDASATDALTMDRYDLMRAKQQLAQPVQSMAVPVNEAPVLPELLPRPPGTAPAVQK